MPFSKGLGYIPDPIDKRDIPMEAVLPVFNLPTKVDYTEQMTPVRDQGQEGTCVGFASTAVKEYQEKKEHNKDIILSPRFLYQKCKEIDGIPDQEGTYPRIAMKILQKNRSLPGGLLAICFRSTGHTAAWS